MSRMPRGLRLVRIEQLALLVLGLFLLLGIRLFQLQIVCHDRYRERQVRQVDARQPLPARRGRILDRTGRVLALDVVAYDVSVVRKRVRKSDLQELASALDLPMASVRRTLRAGARYVTLGHGVTLTPAAAKRLAHLPGVCLDRRSFRQYPYGTLAAQYLGFTDSSGRGAEGVERAFDSLLHGMPGELVVLCDEQGRPIGQRTSSVPRDGADVTLSLDVELQRIVDDELQRAIEETQAVGGSIVIVDPHAGDLLAIANAPTPARRGGTYDADAWRNRAVYDLFEPGSTLKPVTAIAALRHGVAAANTHLFGERGAMRFGRAAQVHDAHREGEGWITLAEAFARSSNICFAKLAEQLPSSVLYEELRNFGFGSRSGIDLVGEPRGQLALPRNWSGRTRLTLGYGQEIGVTALQLVGLYTAIANGGSLLQPRVALQVGEEPVPTRTLRRVLPPDLAAEIRRFCALAVESGTGKNARTEGVAVAGKTGTAEKAMGGRYVDRYVASFAGLAPADSPRLVILVVLDEPRGHYHWGGSSAAPTFRRVLESVLRSTDYLGPRAERVTVVRGRELQGGDASFASPLRLATLGGASLPDLRGLRLRVASRWLRRMGFEPRAEGSGVVRAQWPSPGEPLARGREVRLRCQPDRAPDRRAALWPQ
jgi:cell division protein FtsI (penicillin-binding protein 3)